MPPGNLTLSMPQVGGVHQRWPYLGGRLCRCYEGWAFHMARVQTIAACWVATALLGGCTVTGAQRQREERMQSSLPGMTACSKTRRRRRSCGPAARQTLVRFLFDGVDREPMHFTTAPVDMAALADPPAVACAPLGSVIPPSSEIEGQRVLCDPDVVRAQLARVVCRPRRFTTVPVALADLPRPIWFVISHDHFDHLDRPAVEALAAARGVPFVVPLGVGEHLEAWGIPPRASPSSTGGNAPR